MPFDFTTQPQSGGRVFDMGGQAFLGILTGKKKLPGSRSLPFTNPVHRAGKAKDNEPRFERQDRPPETRSSMSPAPDCTSGAARRQLPCNKVFESVFMMGVTSPSGRTLSKAL
jgi:hypothetical protein